MDLRAAAALLQATGERTGVFVAVAVLGAFAIIAVYFLLRSGMDQRAGRYDEEATYVLGRGGDPRLSLVGQGEVVPVTTHRLGQAGLAAFVRKVESRNDMGVEHLVLDDGSQVPYVTSKGSLDRVEQVVLSDSRGQILVDADGRVVARPPLDDAVKQDLEELLVDVIGPSKEI